jgi:hypothetical protein
VAPERPQVVQRAERDEAADLGRAAQRRDGIAQRPAPGACARAIRSGADGPSGRGSNSCGYSAIANGS